MNKSIVGFLVSMVSGLVFGLGLAVSGMTNPAKVLGFLDLAGAWDPSLLFVLGGAVGVTVVTFHFILRRTSPLRSTEFHVSHNTVIDRKLLIGALLFGAGWGISGYCPGPAIASLAEPNWETWIFLPAMLAGLIVQQLVSRRG